ncbi:arf-GAP with GTPase, ANK repeat and PH domain-containing protein 2 [Aplochiton taeniatus]
MSGDGALQQRTTYLISLTLVKVEALQEHGGEEAKPTAQGTEAQPGAAAPRAGPKDGGEGVAGTGTGVLVQAADTAQTGGPTGVGNGAGAKDGFQTDEGGGGQAQLTKDARGEPPLLGAEKGPECLEGETSPGVNEPSTNGSKLPPPPGNLPIPSAVERVSSQTFQSAESQSVAQDKTVAVATPEVKTFMSSTRSSPSPTEWAGCDRTTPRGPPRAGGQRPVSLMKTHSSASRSREAREARSPTSAQSLDRKDSRISTRSPGPCRASWAESETRVSRSQGWRDDADRGRPGATLEVVSGGGGGGGAVMCGDNARKETLKSGSASLPAPATLATKPQRKGKSRTLDNSDLNILSEEQAQRGGAKDRKMLKFISGIFSKSSTGPVGAGGPANTNTPTVCIQRESSEEEAALANSQEWTLSRSIPELRLGVLGSLKSGRSALVNKYITGTYQALEKLDSGRHKKEVLVEGQSHLLLIREEAGPPDAQFSSWVDGVVLVFSLENEASFQEVYQLYSQLNTQRSTADIPLIVVATQDKISSTNPRVIEDLRVRQLCVDVRHAIFYETCATYGFNVDRVFNEASLKIVSQRRQAALLACKSLPNSPSHSGGSTPGSASFPGQASNGGGNGNDYYPSSLPSTPVLGHRELRGDMGSEGFGSGSLRNIPSRRPSLFRNRDRRGSDSEKKALDASKGDAGRPTAIKQSLLWKRSGSSLNKEWKKKYVTLSNNGTLSYHSNEYKQNAHGKVIDLLTVTVKVPGKRPPRAVTPAGPAPGLVGPSPGVNGVAKELNPADTAANMGAPLLTPSGLADDRAGALSPQGERGLQRCPSSLSAKAQSVDALEGTTNPFVGKDSGQSSPMSDRKKKGRKKSMNQKGDSAVGQAEAKRKMWKLKSFGSLRNINKTEEENSDFIIVSSTGQQWHFEAQSLEDRDAWVAAIESQIFASLQSCESGRNKKQNSQSEAVALQAIRNAKGNNLCVDCEAPNPTWASLNLGALICIECSGIHRNLGTHLSRVRSLDLDDWPGELTQVLAAIGNHLANSIWESCPQGRTKPAPNASREEREAWIRAKYEQRSFVAPLLAAPGSARDTEDEASHSVPVWLLSAVVEKDLPRLLLLLAHSTKEQINSQPAGAPSHPRTALHAACQLGDVVMTQLLVWYGSDVKSRDPQGQTALTMAKRTGSKGCADILLQHGCPNETSPTGATPVLSRRSSTASLGRTNSRRRVS